MLRVFACFPCGVVHVCLCFGRASVASVSCEHNALIHAYERPRPHGVHIRVSIVVSISACHADDPGSIPGRGMFPVQSSDREFVRFPSN